MEVLDNIRHSQLDCSLDLGVFKHASQRFYKFRS